MADAKNIRVSEEVHAKVSEIADKNFRGMGDQVAYWAAHTCAHPQASRVAIHVVVSVVEQATKKTVARVVGVGQPYRGFFCSTCGQYVFPELPEEVNQALSKPIVAVK